MYGLIFLVNRPNCESELIHILRIAWRFFFRTRFVPAGCLVLPLGAARCPPWGPHARAPVPLRGTNQLPTKTTANAKHQELIRNHMPALDEHQYPQFPQIISEFSHLISTKIQRGY